MKNAPTVFAQIMAGLDATELARAAARFPMPRTSRTLRPYDHFAAMVFAQLTFRESLRGIETCLRARPALSYQMGIRGRVTRTNLAYANDHRGWRVFAEIAGVLMLLATYVFWLGRYKFAHIPPAGKEFFRENFNREGWRIIGRIALIYAFLPVFWSLWYQSGAEWVLQAEKMERHCTLFGFSFEVLSSQVQVMNGVFILLLIPLCQYWIYPAISRVFPLTPHHRIQTKSREKHKKADQSQTITEQAKITRPQISCDPCSDHKTDQQPDAFFRKHPQGVA